MKLIFLIMVSFSMALYCCKTTAQSNHKKNSCDTMALRKDIEQNWKYSEFSDCYMTTDSFFKRLNLDYQDCLIAVDTSVIINYFGRKFSMKRITENDTTTFAIQYVVSPPIPENLKLHRPYHVYYISFYVNGKSKVSLIKKEKFITGNTD